jgi:hypothetical protein
VKLVVTQLVKKLPETSLPGSQQPAIGSHAEPDESIPHTFLPYFCKIHSAIGSWKKLHNDELHNLYSSPNIVRVIKSRRMRWAGHVARMGEGRGVYRILIGRPEGKRPLGRPRRRWEDNIKLDLSEIGIDGANWIQLAQNRAQWWAFVKTVTNIRVP